MNLGAGREAPAPYTAAARLLAFLRRTPTQASLLVCTAVAYLGHLQFQTPYLVEPDAYYHTKVASLVRTTGILHAFPWANFSSWRDQFFDKDFGYHLLLSLFAGGDLELGGKLAAVAFGAGFFVSFYFVLRLSGVRKAWLWTLLLLVGSGHYFGWRVNTTRPQVLSMILSLWAAYFVLRRAKWRLFGVSVLYALSYTAPYLTIGYAALGAVAERLVMRRWSFAPLLAAALGVAVGWLVHPNFPANFVAGKIQSVDVLMSAWQLSGPPLHLAGELGPAPLGAFIIEHLLLLAAMGAAAFAVWRGRCGPTAPMLTLVLTSLVTFALACVSKRFIEYWVPFAAWACAAILDGDGVRWQGTLPQALQLRPWSRVCTGLVVAAVVALCARSYWAQRQEFARPQASGEKAAALWLAEHTPLGSQVFTCDWDDAPELFFFNHHNRYLVFLDPNYFYRWRPELWQLWDDTANARVRESPVTIIRNTFGARYGFCTRDFTALYSRLERDPRVIIHMVAGSGYLFEIVDGLPLGVPAAAGSHP